MMHVSRLDLTGEPALVDAAGQRHRLPELVTTIAELEGQWGQACATPGPVAAAIARILEQSLARRYVLVYLLDSQRWPQRMGGRYVPTN